MNQRGEAGMNRPLFRRRWNEAEGCPGPMPWAARVWFVVALPVAIPVVWWRLCRCYRWSPNYDGDSLLKYTPPGLRWELGLAWMYWRHWHWSDWR